MSLILDGTNGVSDIDGSAATPAIRGTDANTGIFFPAADTIAFSEGGAESMRIDANGNVGIGVVPTTLTAAASSLQVYGGASQARLALQNATTGSTSTSGFQICAIGSRAVLDQRSNSSLEFTTNATERMQIDSSGNVLVGTTSWSSSSNGISLGNNTNSRILITNSADYALEIYGATTNRISFSASNSATRVGSITVNTTNTAYNTSSDYRLKENIAPMTGALTKVTQLKPVTYTWKEDGSSGQGFIAHELQAVVPECVTGEKDAVDAEGKIKPQGIDTSFLVATLTAAIQELKAIVDAQAARIAALESAK